MELIAALADLCKEKSRPVIAIDGPAGAGKTTLAHEIFLALSNKMSVQVIHMDDLYDGWDNALSKDLSKILQYLVSQHEAKSPANIQRYNWESSSFGKSRRMISPFLSKSRPQVFPPPSLKSSNCRVFGW